jgi:hypothetical protein
MSQSDFHKLVGLLGLQAVSFTAPDCADNINFNHNFRRERFDYPPALAVCSIVQYSTIMTHRIALLALSSNKANNKFLGAVFQTSAVVISYHDLFFSHIMNHDASKPPRQFIPAYDIRSHYLHYLHHPRHPSIISLQTHVISKSQTRLPHE